MPKYRKTTESESQLVLGIAWYRRDQWSRLRELSLDADELEATYEEWLVWATERLEELKAKGVAAHKVDVDVEELLNWCWKNALPVAGPARAQFAAEHIGLKMGEERPPARDVNRT